MTTAPQTAGKARISRRRVRSYMGRGIVLLVLTGFSLMFLFPFFWMLATALKPLAELYASENTFWPKDPQWGNFLKVFTTIPFAQYTLNSVIVTGLTVLGSVVTSSIVAYAFARLRWPGRNVCFAVLMATMMIPGQVLQIPSYTLFSAIGWTNTYLPLIVPFWCGGGAFNIFLLRQFYRSLPKELSESARIDGCRELGIWARIVMPLCKPVLATVAIFAFMFAWNDFMGPLIYVKRPAMHTIALGLRAFQQQHTAQWDLMMAGAILSMLPTLILYFAFQKHFVEGIKMSGIKG